MNKSIIGDCRKIMKQLIADGVKVHTCVTSPPYWGLRDYGNEPTVWGGDATCEHEWGTQKRGFGNSKKGNNGSTTASDPNHALSSRFDSSYQWCKKCGAWLGCFGLEPTPELYVEHSVEIFQLVRELLADDGTLWLNLGDSFASGKGKCYNPGGNTSSFNVHLKAANVHPLDRGNKSTLAASGLKPKDLIGIPWRVAFALQAAGWYLRSDIIWHKPNPMPESVTDRPTKAHEYIFLMSKNAKYYYDAEAIKEQNLVLNNEYKTPDGWDTTVGYGGHGTFHKAGREKGEKGYQKKGRAVRKHDGANTGGNGSKIKDHCGRSMERPDGKRNKRTVWTVTTQPYSEAHFATFPPKLIEPCILAGSHPGDIVLDPFFGSGTTGEVAEQLGRQWIGIELNEAYKKLQQDRTAQQGMRGL